jgi:2-desacetyl-2-hydroxyethyl bacteriochlorophyllide A dehydrogenase
MTAAKRWKEMSTEMSSKPVRRRVLMSAPGTVEVVTEPVPGLERDDALVELSLAGVCGSDKAALHGEHAFMGPPYYPGHEVVGVVIAVGEEVDEVGVGDRVTVEPTLPCGRCKPCLSNAENLCEDLRFFGCGYREGAMADVFSVPASRLHKIPAGLTDEQAVLIEPVATGVHAARVAGDLSGKTVAVLGSGTIGLMTMIAAREGGARRIVITDFVAAKRQLALELGADAVVDAAAADLAGEVRAELGESGDVVFDCVANQQTLPEAIKVALKGGTVMVVGGARRPVTIDLPVVQEFQVRVQGVATYRSEDYRDAIGMLARGVIDVDRFVTATFPLPRADEAFAALDTGQEVKILVAADPDGRPPEA